MKKLIILPGLFLIFSPILPVKADTTVTVDDNSQVSVKSNQPTGTQTTVVETAPAVQQTPVIITKEENPKEFEGAITQIDYPKSEIVVHDTNGRDRRVLIKQGMINNYKVDDYVKVTLMADLKEAKMVHVVREASNFEGTIVSVDPSANQLIVIGPEQKDKKVLVEPGMISAFKSGDRVKVYVIADEEKPKLIRILK